jgi:hypothetical protein
MVAGEMNPLHYVALLSEDIFVNMKRNKRNNYQIMRTPIVEIRVSCTERLLRVVPWGPTRAGT